MHCTQQFISLFSHTGPPTASGFRLVYGTVVEFHHAFCVVIHVYLQLSKYVLDSLKLEKLRSGIFILDYSAGCRAEVVDDFVPPAVIWFGFGWVAQAGWDVS